MKTFEDQLHGKITLEGIPQRIISIVPSQTELLYDLGLNDEVAGITQFCIHPNEWYRTKTRVGGTKRLNIEKIKAINPDLIIGNKEENDEKQINKLMKDYNVWMSDIKTLDDAYKMIEQVGIITGKEEKANAINNQIKQGFANLKPFSHSQNKVAYLIWYQPIMVVSKQTFINEILGAMWI